MKQLSPASQEKAVRFLLTRSRPLEKALFEHEFSGGPVEKIYRALAHFQNPDGGFGRALEPDVRTPSSSALASGMALHQLQKLGCDPESSLVTGALTFLQDAYLEAEKVWRAVPGDTNRYPHAPWWHDQEGSLRARFDGFQIIPRVLILSALAAYQDQLPEPWLHDLTVDTLRTVEGLGVLGTGGGSDLEYVRKLAEVKSLGTHERSRLERKITRDLPQAVSRNPREWTSYVITPLKAAPHPLSPGAELIADLVEQNLDFVIEQQSPEGCWEPTWSWGRGQYEAEWAHAREEWCGILTLETLIQLRSYGRLAKGPLQET